MQNTWMRQMVKAVAVLVATAAGAAAQQVPEAKEAKRSETDEPQRIVVSIPDRKLALLDANGTVLKTYDVAVGKRATPSPTGSFKVVVRVANPTYYHGGKLIGPGKSNPVGTRWIGLSKKSYGIHGTNVPSSIGRAASHGCVRMRNHDVEELFELVRAGDIVELHGERDELVAQLFNVPQAAAEAAGGAQ